MGPITSPVFSLACTMTGTGPPEFTHLNIVVESFCGSAMVQKYRHYDIDPRNAEYHWNITGTPKPKVLNFPGRCLVQAPSIAHRLQGTTTRGRRVATPTSRVPWTLDILDCWQCGIQWNPSISWMIFMDVGFPISIYC